MREAVPTVNSEQGCSRAGLFTSSWECSVSFSPKLPIRWVCYCTLPNDRVWVERPECHPTFISKETAERKRNLPWWIPVVFCVLGQWTLDSSTKPVNDLGVWLVSWGDTPSFMSTPLLFCVPSGTTDKQYGFCTQRLWNGPKVHYFNWFWGHSVFMAISAFYFQLQTLSRHSIQLSLSEILQPELNENIKIKQKSNSDNKIPVA